MVFRGMEPIRSKICSNDRILEHINTFSYLGYNVSYKREKNLNIKTANFVKILAIINHISKPTLVSRHTRIKIYMRLRKGDEKRLTAEVCFMRRAAGYTLWGHKCSDKIVRELQIPQITEETAKNTLTE
jgi:hypothetical protein